MSVLEARNITKVFPGTVALDDVSVSFDRRSMPGSRRFP